MLNKVYSLILLNIIIVSSASACSSCIEESSVFYKTLNEHLELISKTISNGIVDSTGYYIANEKQIEENIAATKSLKNGDFFYFSSSEKQRSAFKKCSFSRIYSGFKDFGKTLTEIKYCPINYCNESITKELAGLTIKMLEKELTTCKLELEATIESQSLEKTYEK